LNAAHQGPLGLNGMYELNLYGLIPSPRWVRTYFNRELIADSREIVLFCDRPYPNYQFPKQHVQMAFLHESDYVEEHPARGRTAFWHLEVADKRVENAAFSHLDHGADGYIGFKWNVMDRWLEEEEQIYVHARNPYHRVDAVPSSRHIEVSVAGVSLADSTQPVLLFDTGLPTRYYLPRRDVRSDLLVRTDTVTQCPYKGFAETYAVRLPDQMLDDYAWCYPTPIPACANIAELICFYNEVVDIREDGTLLKRPVTHFK
jgi:uncharacterized protein (DUF427 family)